MTTTSASPVCVAAIRIRVPFSAVSSTPRKPYTAPFRHDVSLTGSPFTSRPPDSWFEQPVHSTTTMHIILARIQPLQHDWPGPAGPAARLWQSPAEMSYPGRDGVLLAEPDGAEGRDGDVERQLAAVGADRGGLDGAEVALAAAAEVDGVGVEQLEPAAGAGGAEGVVEGGARGEVEGGDDGGRAAVAEPLVEQDRVLGVVGVEPVEAGR